MIERPWEASFRDVDDPVCGPADVVVLSHKAGVCRTDLEVFAGELDSRWVRFPCIPGHEWSGTVAEVGADVAGFEPGDRVVCEGIIPCRRCARCRAGDTNLCQNYDALGFTRPGGYAEYVVAPRHVVHRLPDHVSFDAAVLIEPGSVVLRALERARPQAGESIGVIGIGTLGALVLVIARLFSPARLVAYGIRDEELELALQLGADEALHADAPGEGGHDVVLETAGAVPAVELALGLVREGGRIALIGIAGEGKELTIPADRIALRDLQLLGSVGYTSAVWARMVDLVSKGLVRFDGIVTHHVPASEFERAFELMERREGKIAKVVLEHVAG